MSDESKAVTIKDLTAAKDAALQCVEAVRQVCSFGKSSIGPRIPRKAKGAMVSSEPAQESVQKTSLNSPSGTCNLVLMSRASLVVQLTCSIMEQNAKTAILACTTAAEKLHPLYTNTIRDTLVLANKETPKGHDTSLLAARRAYELLFMSTFPTVKSAHQTHQRENVNLLPTESLQKFFDELSGPAGANYWAAVMAHAAKWEFKADEFRERVEHEWAAAVQRLEEKNTVDADEVYSVKRYTPKDLRRLFGISQNTLLGWLNKQQVRNIRHSSKSYQIHKEDLPNKEN